MKKGLIKRWIEKARQSSARSSRTQDSYSPTSALPETSSKTMDHHPPETQQDERCLKPRNPSVQPTNVSISITSMDEWVEGLLHLPTMKSLSYREDFGQTAAILFAGVFGGFGGPSGMYEDVAYRLASGDQGIPVLRLDYRYPAILPSCIQDLQSSMIYLENKCAILRFVLVGWSFGGAVAYTTAALDREKVVGCATIASQLDGTSGIKSLSPIPVLLIHGTADHILGASCSEVLFQRYGSDGDRMIHFFKGDDHDLTQNRSEAVDLLCEFITRCADIKIHDKRAEEVTGER